MARGEIVSIIEPRVRAKSAYGKGEYSQARGQHWRGTVTVVVPGGRSDDFLDQYEHNSHVTLTARYSL